MSFVSLGSPDDPEASGNGTIIGILKRQRTILASIAALLAGTIVVSGTISVGNVPHVVCDSGCTGGGGGGIVQQGAKDASAQRWIVDGSGVIQPVSQSGSWSVSVSGTPSDDVTDRVGRLLGIAATNADTTIGGTTAPSKGLLVLGKTNDGTPQYQPIPLTAGGANVNTRGLIAAIDAVNVGQWLGSTAPTVGSKTSANSVPVVVASDQSTLTVTQAAGAQISIGSSTNKTNVLKTGSITTTAVTADQVILTYTVTGGKTFYLEYVGIQSRLTAVAATASILGAASVETPSGTKVITQTFVNPTTSAIEGSTVTYVFAEPIPIAAAAVIRVVTTPAATTSMLWIANFGGYEK